MTAEDQDRGLPDLQLYERLIADGIAAANNRGGVVDHVTARRLAIWLAARPQAPEFTRGLLRFIHTGAIARGLRSQLRIHARSPLKAYPDKPQASRLMDYCVARDDLGPVGLNFGKACDDIDRADVMLARLHDRARQGQPLPEPAWPDSEGLPLVALAHQDLGGRTVSLVMDTTTANITMFAVAAYAGDREAHVREVEHYAEKLPKNSYGRRNREAIAVRESRVAARLREVERAYRAAIERDAAPTPAPTRTIYPAEYVADHEMELD